jgi:multicomponent Na+:H+ antiporter subunit C
MDTAIAILTGLFFATSIYLMLSRHIIRILLGVAILGNAVNLTIFTNGRTTREVPPIIPDDARPYRMRQSPIRCRRRSCSRPS